jgi:hypothetical protein
MSDFKNFFIDSGPQEILNYINLRIQAGDLTSEEALALLSAVHAELGNRFSVNTRVYLSYTRTMKSMQKALPEIYDYVVSVWSKKNKTNPISLENQLSNFNDDNLEESKPQFIDFERDITFSEMKTSAGELDETDEQQEQEELNENETDLNEKVAQKEVDSGQEEQEEETMEDNIQENDKTVEVEREADDRIDGESERESEADESSKGDEEIYDSENVFEEKDKEPTEEPMEEPEIKEIVNEAPDENDKRETGSGSSSDKAEMEWPEIEPPTTEIPLENLEGEDNAIEPED